MTLTAADHRERAQRADRDAITARTATESRAKRREAQGHRLRALLTEYQITQRAPT